MFRLALKEVLLFLSDADPNVIVCFGLNPYPYMVICILVVVGCCVLIPLVPLSRYLCKETRSRGKIIRRNPGMYAYQLLRFPYPILNCLQIMQYEVFLYPEWWDFFLHKYHFKRVFEIKCYPWDFFKVLFFAFSSKFTEDVNVITFFLAPQKSIGLV